MFPLGISSSRNACSCFRVFKFTPKFDGEFQRVLHFLVSMSNTRAEHNCERIPIEVVEECEQCETLLHQSWTNGD